MKAILLISTLSTLSLSAMQETPSNANSLQTIIDEHKKPSQKKRLWVSNALNDPKMKQYLNKPYLVAHALSSSYGIEQKHTINALKEVLVKNKCVSGMGELLTGGETPHLIDYAKSHHLLIQIKNTSLLLRAVERDDNEMAELILSKGGGNLLYGETKTALSQAVTRGNIQLTKQLSKVACINEHEFYPSPLLVAIQTKNIEIAIILLQNGASFDRYTANDLLGLCAVATDEQKKEFLKFALPRPRL